MRKIILGVAISLDSCIEGPNGEYDWCYTDQDYGMKDFLHSIDAIFMGRKTYEVAGGNPFPKKQCYVFSNRLPGNTPGVEIVKGDIVPLVRDMKLGPGKDIWLFGGASLSQVFLENKLVDELWLSIHPIVLGRGKLLFSGLNERMNLELISTKKYNTGLVSVNYKIL